MSPMVSTPRACSLAAVLAPMPHIRSTGSAWRKASSPTAGHDEQPVGLGHGAGDLGQELGAGDADADRQAHPFAHRAAQTDGDLGRRAGRAPQPAHVEERLVDRDAFDERRRVVEHLEHRLAGGGVGGQVRFDEDGVGAQPPGDRPAHRGAHAVRPRLVAGAHHHAHADDHRAAAQLGMVALLHRGEEGIEVGVEDRRVGCGHEHTFAIAAPVVKPMPANRPDASTMSDVSEAIRAAIDAAGGAIPFSEFQRLALYGPRGLLHPARRAGRAGRAPRWRLHHLARGGPVVRRRPRPLPRRRVGGPRAAGPVHRRRRRRRAGDAGAAVLAAAPRCAPALRYVAVEISESQRALHPSGVESRPDVPGDRFVGVVVANELLDNLPIRLCVFDGSWREAMVVVAPDGTFAEVLSAPLDPLPVVLPATAPHGGPRPAPRRRRRVAGRGAGERRARPRRRLRLRPRHDRRARPPAVAGLAAHVPRPRARRPLPQRAGHPGHHGRARPRPVLRTGRRAHPGAVPAPVGHRRAGRRGRQRMDRTSGPPRPGRPRHAQPARRGRGPARPDRPRRLRRRGVDRRPDPTGRGSPTRQFSILLSRCRSTRR